MPDGFGSILEATANRLLVSRMEAEISWGGGREQGIEGAVEEVSLNARAGEAAEAQAAIERRGREEG